MKKLNDKLTLEKILSNSVFCTGKDENFKTIYLFYDNELFFRLNILGKHMNIWVNDFFLKKFHLNKTEIWKLLYQSFELSVSNNYNIKLLELRLIYPTSVDFFNPILTPDRKFITPSTEEFIKENITKLLENVIY